MNDDKGPTPSIAFDANVSSENVPGPESEVSARDPSPTGAGVQRTRRLDFDSTRPSPGEAQSPANAGIPPTKRLPFSGGSQSVESAEPPRAVGSGEDQVDLANMSIEELKVRKEEVERKLLEKQEPYKRAAIDRIVEVVHEYNISVDELVQALGGLPAKRLGPAAKRYRDPETGSTWSGRGKEPAWIRGKDRTKFMI